MIEPEEAPTCGGLRDLVAARCGFDPGELSPAMSLDRAGIHGLNRLLVIVVLEDVYGIEYPADLVSAMETVDDLIHFTGTIIGHRSDRPG